MFTFGYKSKINGPMRAVIALVIGIMMVVSPANALTTIVKVIAAFLLASGAVSLLVGLRDKDKGSLPLMSVNALVDVVLGLVLFCMPGPVAGFIIYLIGFALLFFGIIQIVALVGARNMVNLGLGAFVLPVIVTFVGAFILFNPFAKSVMTLIAGSALIVYGVSELLSSWKMKKAIEEFEITQAPAEEQSSEQEDDLNNVKDVDYEKVDEQ